MEARTTIKGKYVGKITIDFSADENMDGLRPIDEIINAIKNETAEMIADAVSDEVNPVGTVLVETEYADAYVVDGGEDDATD